MKHPEYTKDNYPSMGKTYNGEKAIISLTSWKARINTVSKTLFSLIKMCPGFHIVLCLSEEEFPKMEKELPEDLMLFVDNKLIEILWVYKNYKSFKKVLFTMDKYRDVPVISADDDCLYTCNYANELYIKLISLNDNKAIIRWTHRTIKPIGTQGPCTIYSPEKFLHFYENELKLLTKQLIHESKDDDLAETTINKFNLHLYDLNKTSFPYKFHTSDGALHPEQKNMKCWKNCFI